MKINNVANWKLPGFHGFCLLWFLLFLLYGCRKAPERTLVIISPHWDGIRREFSRAFADWHQERHGERVELEWRDVGGTTDSLKYVVSRFKKEPEGIGIDIFFGGGTDPFLDLQKEGLTASYQPSAEILNGIPTNVAGLPLYDPDFHWFGAALSSFGIVANDRVIQYARLPKVTAWKDLTKPELRSWISAGDLRNSGTVHLMYEIILQGYGWKEGWEIITKIAANSRSIEKNASTMAKEATYGNVAYAMAIDFYGLTQVGVAGSRNMHFLLPEDYTMINPDGICILKGAPNRKYAEHFLDFVLSEEGQNLWMLPVGHPGGARKFAIERLSIRPELYDRHKDISSVQMNPFHIRTTLQYNSKLAGKRWRLINGLIGSSLIDLHSDLVKAWEKAANHPKLASRLVEPPLSEEEATGLLEAYNDKNNAEFRNAKHIEWQRFAQKRYREIMDAR